MGGLTREITEPASRTQAFLTPNLGVLCHEKAAVTGLIQRPPERSEPRRLLCVPATQVSRPGGPTSCLTERGTAGVAAGYGDSHWESGCHSGPNVCVPCQLYVGVRTPDVMR